LRRKYWIAWDKVVRAFEVDIVRFNLKDTEIIRWKRMFGSEA